MSKAASAASTRPRFICAHSPSAQRGFRGTDAAAALMFQGKSFEDLELPHLTRAAQTMFDELAWWATMLKGARDSTPASVA